MSDEPKPEETPLPADAPQSAGQTPAGQQAGTVPPTPQTPGLKPSPAPIDYALPTQKKSWLPTPAMIRNIGCLLKLIVGFTVLICMGYFALVALNPKARQWALQGSRPGPGGTPPSGKGPTPFKALNQILAIPAQAMGKTDDVVKANNARVGQLDGVIAEEESRAKGGKAGRGNRPVVDPFSNPPTATSKDAARAAGAAEATESGPQAVSAATLLALAEKRGATVAPSETSEPGPPVPASRPQIQDPGPQSPDEMKLAGDIVIAQASPAGAPRASAAFFYSIVKLTVSGITQGKPARALINNRLAQEGDEINRQLGIVFLQLDAMNKQLVFRDATGALVTRSY
jgi:hypothetical protein